MAQPTTTVETITITRPLKVRNFVLIKFQSDSSNLYKQFIESTLCENKFLIQIFFSEH